MLPHQCHDRSSERVFSIFVCGSNFRWHRIGVGACDRYPLTQFDNLLCHFLCGNTAEKKATEKNEENKTKKKTTSPEPIRALSSFIEFSVNNCYFENCICINCFRIFVCRYWQRSCRCGDTSIFLCHLICDAVHFRSDVDTNTIIHGLAPNTWADMHNEESRLQVDNLIIGYGSISLASTCMCCVCVSESFFGVCVMGHKINLFSICTNQIWSRI